MSKKQQEYTFSLINIEQFRYCPLIYNSKMYNVHKSSYNRLRTDIMEFLSIIFKDKRRYTEALGKFTAKYADGTMKEVILDLITNFFPSLKAIVAVNLPTMFRAPYLDLMESKQSTIARVYGSIDILAYVNDDQIPTCIRLMPTEIPSHLLPYDLYLNSYHQYMKEKTQSKFKVGVLSIKPYMLHYVEEFKLPFADVLSDTLACIANGIYVVPHVDRCFQCPYEKECDRRRLHEKNADNVGSPSSRHRFRQRWTACGHVISCLW